MFNYLKKIQPWYIPYTIAVFQLIIAAVQFYLENLSLGISALLLTFCLYTIGKCMVIIDSLIESNKFLRTRCQVARSLINQQEHELRFKDIKFSELQTKYYNHEHNENEELADNAGAIG
jgi:hypothetical protein